jgi:predicted Zn-dependent peptidase
VNEQILSHRFPNGLVLVAEPMMSVQSAAFTLMAPAGCVHDPPDRAGLGGFACEMTLRGSGERDNRRFVLDLDNLGVERSEFVSDSHVGYSGVTVAENLHPALAIYADVVRRPSLSAEQLESARQVMLLELQAVEDEPAQKTMIELRRRYYPDPWGRPSQGEREALETISLEEIHRHVARRYHAAGAILAVAGRFDWRQLEDTVGGLLGDWQARDVEEIAQQSPDGGRMHLPCDTQQTQIGIAYDCVPYRHEDYFQAWGAVGVLSGGMSSRLFTEVRERRGLCYHVHAACHSLRDRAGVFCYAGTSADRAQETLDVTLAELVRLGRGVEADELDRLKARIKSALIMQQESSSARSAAVARDWHHLGRVRTLDELGRLIDALSCRSINAYLAEHPPRDFTIVTLGPQTLEAP